MRNWVAILVIIMTLVLFCGCNMTQDSEVDYVENKNIKQQDETYNASSIKDTINLKDNRNAKRLNDLGLLKDLDVSANDVPTMIDIVNMILPITDYDESMNVSAIPFIDVGNDYTHKVGYLYQNKIIFGANNNELGCDEPCDSATFLTIVMRILGYDIDINDDIYRQAISIRLITQKYSNHLLEQTFTVSDAAKILYQALWLKTDAGMGNMLGSVVLEDQNKVDFEYLDFDIYGNVTTPIKVIDFDKYKINSYNILDTKNKSVFKYKYDRELICGITEDGYLELNGTQELLGTHKFYSDKDILQQNDDYGMEFTLKINSIGNEGSENRTIISIIPRSADEDLDGYYAINYYAETVYVEGMTSNLFRCKWSLTNTNAPTGNEPLVTKHLLLEENVDYKCRLSVENNDDGDVEIEFYIDGPNVECDTFEPLIKYVDSSEYKISESSHGPAFVYSGRTLDDEWGFPANVKLDDITLYTIDDFRKNNENYADYFGENHCLECHHPSLAKCTNGKDLINTVDYLIRQGVLPKQAHYAYQSEKTISRIDLLKVLINYLGYRFEAETSDSDVLDKALELNIIDEKFDGQSEYITRNEASFLFYNISKLVKPVKGYTKLISDEVSADYESYIDYCVQNYYLRLDDELAFNGDDNLSIKDMVNALCIMSNSVHKKDNQPLSLPYIFDDYSVLQREKPIYIWGYGIENDTVTVELNGQTKTAKVVDGRWQVILDEQKAGGPYTLNVSDSATSIKRKMIYVGEVFILAGQSNMGWMLKDSDGYEETVRKFASSDILHCFEHQKILGYGGVKPSGNWLKAYANGYVAEEASGVGMFTAEMIFELNKEELKGVKIGAIPISYGGSTIEVLMPPNGIKQYNDAPIYNSYFNGYMREMFPYSARAVLYYQGENSVQLRYSYEPYLRQLITSYRKIFGDEELPFYLIQLAAYGENYDDVFNTWPNIREIQMRTANTMEGVSLVTAIDLGDKDDHLNIHPTNKKPIGERLAYLISDDLFGKDYNKKSPEIEDVELVFDEYILTFDQQDIVIKEGNQDYNFDIYDGLSKEWKEAVAYLGQDNKVHVKSELVSKPEGIRYAWYNYMDVALFNSFNMPVLPFNTRIDLENVPDFKDLRTDKDTLNMPNHLLSTGDYIINVTKGYVVREVESINANVVQLKKLIPSQRKGDTIIRLINKGQESAFLGTDETKIVIKDHGLKPGDFIINNSKNDIYRKVDRVLDEDTIVVEKISNQTSSDTITKLKNIGVVFAE